jgi:5-methylcytosine-specific restriction protein A
MLKRKDELQRCALCRREVAQVTRHHLIPKSEGGEETVDLCQPCHKTLHSFFSNKTLAGELHTLDALRRDPDIARYIQWIRPQPDTRISVRTRKDRR